MAIFLSRWMVVAALVVTLVTGLPIGPTLAAPLASLQNRPLVASLFSFGNSRPVNLGLQSGQLKACPQTPNCVSSQAPDADHQVAPLAAGTDPAQRFADLQKTVTAFPGAAIVTAENNYFYAEFTSSIMGFVDDVEFYWDGATGVIQARSASRIGESDFGVNRRRIESIRLALNKAG
jgi:uncharacterized protein (DUF1499 family)